MMTSMRFSLELLPIFRKKSTIYTKGDAATSQLISPEEDEDYMKDYRSSSVGYTPSNMSLGGARDEELVGSFSSIRDIPFEQVSRRSRDEELVGSKAISRFKEPKAAPFRSEKGSSRWNSAEEDVIWTVFKTSFSQLDI
jgi:hypothetical protein